MDRYDITGSPTVSQTSGSGLLTALIVLGMTALAGIGVWVYAGMPM